jgi:hypothetical protein
MEIDKIEDLKHTCCQRERQEGQEEQEMLPSQCDHDGRCSHILIAPRVAYRHITCVRSTSNARTYGPFDLSGQLRAAALVEPR